jgi:hypothetical protein
MSSDETKKNMKLKKKKQQANSDESSRPRLIPQDHNL